MSKKKRPDDDLTFINYLRTLERALNRINLMISDSQQRDSLSEEQEGLVRKIHDHLFWSGEVSFDEKCVDVSKMKIS